MKKLLLSLFVMLCFSIFAIAQNRTINGTVTSKEDGSPLPGVSIRVAGTQIGASTNAQGKFTISAPANATLQVSFIGYKAQSIKLGNSTTVNISLESDNTDLDEVVITGYGVVSKKDFTGAAARVSGDAVKDRPLQSFGQGLTGQATGVSIIQPNGLLNNPPVIRVRGISSISLSSFPLVVVDGVIFPTGDVSSNSAANNPLGDINPSDIESIDILKDAASTALYGSRAAGGVLVITTKKGVSGTTKVSYEGWVSSNKAVRLPELLDAQQYIDVKNNAVKNGLALNPNAVPASQRDANGVSFFPNYNADGSMVNSNWIDEVYRTAYSQNHNLTVSGGTDKTKYYLSGGLTDQDGFLKANNFKRYSGRMNLTHAATNWLSLNLNVNYTNSVNQSPNSGSVEGSAFNSAGLGRIAFALSPNLAVRKADGTYNYNATNTVGNGNNLVPTSWSHPSVMIEQDRFLSKTNRFLTNLGALFTITQGLTLNSTFSWNKSDTESESFNNPLQGDGYSYIGAATNRLLKRNNWNWVNTLQYVKSINGEHNFNFSVSSDVQNIRTEAWGARREGLADPSFFKQFQGTYTSNLASGNAISEVAYQAYLASASYNYKHKYYVSANFRRDGNSGFSEKNMWGNFGGGSVAWEIAQEDFFKNSSLGQNVNSLRLRASYGKVGNGNIGAYNAFTTYGSGLYGNGNLTWSFTGAGNQDLAWETSKQLDIGFNLSMFNNRLSFEMDYFKKDIDNLILDVPQTPSKGIPGGAILMNVGSMYNKGFEFGINATPVVNDKFTWNVNLNFTTIKNEVTALADGINEIIGSTGGLESANITKPGHSISGVFAVETRGVNPQNGRRIYVNAAGKEVQYGHFSGGTGYTYVETGLPAPAITPGTDAKYMGNTLPKWYGGFNNNFKYGNFDLALNFTFSGGNYIYNGSRAGMLDQRVWNNSTEVLTAWKAPGDITKVPRSVYGDNISNGSSYPISDNVEKGDFLRLQVATLGYKIPTSIFKNTGINSFRVYASVNNAFILTKYTGVDPEISTNGNSNTSMGIERNSIPQGRQFTFGLSLGF